MKLEVRANRSEAVRRGVDLPAPHGWALVHCDPEELPEDLREILAQFVVQDNVRCRAVATIDGFRVLLQVAQVGMPGLREALERVRDQLQQRKEKREERAARQLERAMTMLAEWYERGSDKDRWVTVQEKGGKIQVYQHPPYPEAAMVQLPSEPKPLYVEDGSKEDLEKLRVQFEEQRKVYDAAVESHRAAAEEAYATRRAAILAEARECEEWYEKLPQELRDRHRDGFAPDLEIDRAVESLIRKDLGWADTAPVANVTNHRDYRLTDYMSPDEYRAYRAYVQDVDEETELSAWVARVDNEHLYQGTIIQPGDWILVAEKEKKVAGITVTEAVVISRRRDIPEDAGPEGSGDVETTILYPLADLKVG